MKKLMILGAGGYGKTVADVAATRVVRTVLLGGGGRYHVGGGTRPVKQKKDCRKAVLFSSFTGWFWLFLPP